MWYIYVYVVHGNVWWCMWYIEFFIVHNCVWWYRYIYCDKCGTYVCMWCIVVFHITCEIINKSEILCKI